MPASTRTRLESTLGVSLGDVRVHADSSAANAAEAHAARAFTYGSHIFLGAGEQPTDLGLMGHEAAHVVQQRSGAGFMGAPFGHAAEHAAAGGSSTEHEAARAATAATTGGTYAVTSAVPAGQAQYAEEDEGWLEGKIWDILGWAAPNLVPIIRRGVRGVYDWIEDKVTSAVGALVDTVMAPVRAIGSAGAWLHGQFAPLITWVQEAAARLAQNDCGPITEAAQKIEDAATRFITPIVEKVQAVAERVGGFFRGLWDRFGAPVWDFIRQFAGRQWQMLKDLGEWIWDKTAPVRRLADRAWRWLKNKIGIGEGPEGQNGILQWIQGKAGAAWDWLQEKIAPYKRQINTILTVLAGIAVLASPVGPILVLGGIVVGVIQGVRWIRANLGRGDAIVRARVYVQGVLIPQLMAGIGRMTAAVTRMASAVSSHLGSFAAGVGSLVGAAASSALQFLVNAAQWLADRAVELATWATQKLTAFAQWLQTALTRLIAFLRPVLDFLGRVGRLLIDIYGLPFLLAGELWNRIPRCIRDPFVDWIIPLILRQIDIFRELVSTPEAWVKTKADVMNIVRQIFVKKDLRAAMRATFDLILRIFNVPMELLTKVVQKLQVAWDVVIAAPIKFIKNSVRTLGRGLQLYAENLKDNLLNGIEGWLFSELGDRGVQPPKSWTSPWDLAEFALSVMGLSVSHVFDLMEKRIDPNTVAKLRVWWARLSKAWDWITEMKGKNPAEVTAAIISGAKEFAKSIFEGMVTWIVQRVAAELAAMAAAAAASAGLSSVVDAVRRIYLAITSAVRWMRQILQMVDRALDSVINIAAGTIEPAALLLTDALKRATPVVIGFLANQVGLGGVPQKIAEIVDKLRAKVDAAILAIIDALKAVWNTIASGVKQAVGAILEWWKKRLKVGSGSDAHTLSFEGSEDDAELMIASSPRKLKIFLGELKADPKYGGADQLKVIGRAETATDRIASLRGELRAARKANQQPVMAVKATQISDQFDTVGRELGTLFKGDTYGDVDHPIDLAWPAIPSLGYPILYFGGPLPPASRPRSQATMQAMKGKNDETGAEVKEYHPHVPQGLYKGGRIGLGSSYFLAVGSKVGPLSEETTEGGDKLKALIEPYGFSGAEARMDLDHVREIQFGGLAKNDVVANLWPLGDSANRSKGSKLAQAEVEYPAGKRTQIPVMKRIAKETKREFWFKVKSTL